MGFTGVRGFAARCGLAAAVGLAAPADLLDAVCLDIAALVARETGFRAPVEGRISAGFDPPAAVPPPSPPDKGVSDSELTDLTYQARPTPACASPLLGSSPLRSALLI